MKNNSTTKTALDFPKGSTTRSSSQNVSNCENIADLQNAITKHVQREKVSFHTPGHKGRLLSSYADLCELPDLDDLSYPSGVLKELEEKAAKAWGAKASCVSVNGASAGLTAAVIATARSGSMILVPRNAHKSIISGLVLSGLLPVWYEPIWNADFAVWDSVDPDTLGPLLERCKDKLAACVVTSPTYAGAISDIKSIAKQCSKYGICLIVDEAHGAHLAGQDNSALQADADIVVHSLHKTLSGFTQTGLLHVGINSLVDPNLLRQSLHFVQSTSPSYMLMASVEFAVDSILQDDWTQKRATLEQLANRLRANLSTISDILLYTPQLGTQSGSGDLFHILIAHKHISSADLYAYLASKGIYAEALLGNGLLLLLGQGSIEEDIVLLHRALSELEDALKSDSKVQDFEFSGLKWDFAAEKVACPGLAQQIISPRQALLMPSESVSMSQSTGRIAAQAIAPCPPGIPIVFPGQRITKEVVDFGLSADITQINVVLE